VGAHPESMIEAGYYPIQPSEAGEGFMDWPKNVYQWHREGFTLPSSAQKLASGEAFFENQAFQYGDRAFGVQFHPEMTLAMIHRWTTHAAHRLTGPGARPRSEHIAAHNIHGPPLRAWLNDFMSRWIGPASGAQGLVRADRRL